jgi:hypothetical protein
VESPKLRHQLGVNDFFVALAGYARRRGWPHVNQPDGIGLVTWWSETQATSPYASVRPDGYGRWAENGRLVGFYLEYDTGTETLATVARKLNRYVGHYRTPHHAPGRPRHRDHHHRSGTVRHRHIGARRQRLPHPGLGSRRNRPRQRAPAHRRRPQGPCRRPGPPGQDPGLHGQADANHPAVRGMQGPHRSHRARGPRPAARRMRPVARHRTGQLPAATRARTLVPPRQRHGHAQQLRRPHRCRPRRT